MSTPSEPETDILAALELLLLEIDGDPDYFSSINGVLFDTPIDALSIDELAPLPIVIVNEIGNAATDNGIANIGDGRARYDLVMTVQIIGVHGKAHARALRDDIVKAVKLNSLTAAVNQVVLTDQFILPQKQNSNLLLAGATYDITYSKLIGNSN